MLCANFNDLKSTPNSLGNPLQDHTASYHAIGLASNLETKQFSFYQSSELLAFFEL